MTPGPSYKDQLSAMIRGSDVFIAIISPLSVASQEVRDEVNQADLHKKKLLPVQIEDGFDKTLLHEALRHPQWTSLRPVDNFEMGVLSLEKAIKTDFDLLVVHTWLTQRATDWDDRGRPSSGLLSGGDLKEAEIWLSKASANQLELPNVTPLQVDFVVASQRARTRRAQWLVGATGAILVALIILTVYAFQQRRIARKNERTAVTNAKREQVARRAADENAAEAKRQEGIARENSDKERIARQKAEEEARIAFAQALAARAQVALDRFPLRSLLLSTEAVQLTRRQGEPVVTDAEQILRDGLSRVGGRALPGHEGAPQLFHGSAIDPRGRWLAMIGSKDRALLWALAAGPELGAPQSFPGQSSMRAVHRSHPSIRTCPSWNVPALGLRVLPASLR